MKAQGSAVHRSNAQCRDVINPSRSRAGCALATRRWCRSSRTDVALCGPSDLFRNPRASRLGLGSNASFQPQRSAPPFGCKGAEARSLRTTRGENVKHSGSRKNITSHRTVYEGSACIEQDEPAVGRRLPVAAVASPSAAVAARRKGEHNRVKHILFFSPQC